MSNFALKRDINMWGATPVTTGDAEIIPNEPDAGNADAGSAPF